MNLARATALAILCLAPTLAACGGGSGAFVPAPTPVESQAPAVAAGEGFIVNAASAHDDTALLAAGDNFSDHTSVIILCFDLTGIGAVQDAELTFLPINVVGAPWDLGPLVLDHIDGGGVLDAGDQNGGTLTPDVFQLAEQPSYALDVTSLVAADVAAGRTASTFRLRFQLESDLDGVSDFLRIASSNHPTAEYHPTLVVTHLAP